MKMKIYFIQKRITRPPFLKSFLPTLNNTTDYPVLSDTHYCCYTYVEAGHKKMRHSLGQRPFQNYPQKDKNCPGRCYSIKEHSNFAILFWNNTIVKNHNHDIQFFPTR